MKQQKHTTYYPESGSIDSEFHTLDNLPHGEFRSYYPNAKLKIVCAFEHGLLEGAAEFYDEEGTLTQRVRYQRGAIDGATEQFAEKKPVQRIEFKDNLLHGRLTRLHKNGQALLHTHYAEGMKNGTSLLMNDEGKRMRSMNYRNDKLNGETLSYSEGGNVLEKIMYKDDVFHGECLQYDMLSNVKKRLHFQNGQLISAEQVAEDKKNEKPSGIWMKS